MSQRSKAPPTVEQVLAADAEARGIGELLDDYGYQLPPGVAKQIQSLVGAVLGAGWNAPATQPARLAELRDSSSTERLLQVKEAIREALIDRLRVAMTTNPPHSVLVGRGSSFTVAPTATRTLRRIEKDHFSRRQAHRVSGRVRDRRPARQARSTRTTTISRTCSTRRTTTSAGSDDPHPGDSDPPSRLRRLDGGREQDCRDSALNVCWQSALGLGVEELETLSELARIRAAWLDRWDVAA